MNRDEYRKYLNSVEWKVKTAPIRRRNGGMCERCGERKGREVHHKTYERVGNELPSDLIHVCEYCHQLRHLRSKFEPREIRRMRPGGMVSISSALKHLCGPIVAKQRSEGLYSLDTFFCWLGGRGRETCELVESVCGTRYPYHVIESRLTEYFLGDHFDEFEKLRSIKWQQRNPDWLISKIGTVFGLDPEFKEKWGGEAESWNC